MEYKFCCSFFFSEIIRKNLFYREYIQANKITILLYQLISLSLDAISGISDSSCIR